MGGLTYIWMDGWISWEGFPFGLCSPASLEIDDIVTDFYGWHLRFIDSELLIFVYTHPSLKPLPPLFPFLHIYA